MANREQAVMLLVEGSMADVADARIAVRALWARLRTLAARPSVTLDDIDCMAADLRSIETGLAATTRFLQDERAAPQNGRVE